MSLAIPTITQLRQWVKKRNSPLARSTYHTVMALRHIEVPLVRPIHSLLYRLHHLLRCLIASVMRIGYWTPLFRTRVEGPVRRLFLYSGMPQLLGPLRIRIGADCRISGHTTFSGRSSAPLTPLLAVGDNVDISWQTTIAVGNMVVIGNNVRIAGRCFLAGYPGHPLDPEARACGLPETDDQVGDIILEDDVWLATGVSVMAGVTIGRATVVAAGSVVTHDLPPGVLAAGVPARVIRRIVSRERV